jgi:hypothetical protein
LSQCSCQNTGVFGLNFVISNQTFLQHCCSAFLVLSQVQTHNFSLISQGRFNTRV